MIGVGNFEIGGEGRAELGNVREKSWKRVTLIRVRVLFVTSNGLLGLNS